MGEWKLFFCHIPKTGGTSVRRALQALVRPSETVPDEDAIERNGWRYPTLAEALRVAEERADSIRLFRGHYPLACRALLPGEFRTLVVLRDPVERNISYFRHVVCHQGEPMEALMGRLERGEPIGSDNLMTRLLAGRVSRSPDGRRADAPRMVGPIEDPERALDEAIAALDACDYVATTSDLSALEAPLSTLVGQRVSIDLLNESPGPVPSFTPEQISMFERHNRLDRRLYQHALDGRHVLRS